MCLLCFNDDVTFSAHQAHSCRSLSSKVKKDLQNHRSTWTAPPMKGKHGGSPSGEVVGVLWLPGDAVQSWRGTGQQAEESRLQHPHSHMYQAVDASGECPGEHRVVVSTLWFVAAGHVSGRERENLSVKI